MKTDLDIIAEQCAEIDRRNGDAPLPPVRSEPLLACKNCEFWSERGEDWASCVANPIPFGTGIPGRFVQTRRDYLCAYGKRKANVPVSGGTPSAPVACSACLGDGKAVPPPGRWVWPDCPVCKGTGKQPNIPLCVKTDSKPGAPSLPCGEG
jgi:hypothetical protein